jgi:Ribbon-helix-helix protein, copG family.
MGSKNRVTVNLSDDEFAALEDLAERSKLSKAWIGRHAINSLLEKHKEGGIQLLLPVLLNIQKENS